MAEELFVVRVGAGPFSPSTPAHELSGFDLVGPMTKEQAQDYVKEVREAFNEVPNQRFIYGHPIAEVRKLIVPTGTDPFDRSTPRAVASNWYTEEEASNG